MPGRYPLIVASPAQIYGGMLLAALAIISGSAPKAWCQGSADLPLTEIQAAWDRLATTEQAQPRLVHTEGLSLDTETGDGKVVLKKLGLVLPGGYISQSQHPGAEQRDLALISRSIKNDGYFAKLVRANSDAAWRLVALELHDSNPHGDRSSRKLIYPQSLVPLVTLDTTPLPKLAKECKNPIQVTRELDGSAVLVFSPTPNWEFSHFHDCVVRATLDSQKSFRLKQVDVRWDQTRRPQMGRVISEFDYAADPAGEPQLRRISSKWTFPDRPGFSEAYTFAYSDAPTDLDPSQLRLAYYGLPEPNQMIEPGSYRLPAWLYLVVGSVLAVGAGVGILYRARRRRR